MKWMKSIFLTGSVLISTIIIAQQRVSLKGKISDAKTGEGLAGASIYFTDDKMGTIAGNDGSFTILNIPVGHHVVEISHTGYATLAEHMELSKDMEKSFQLTLAVLENQGVVVTGVSSATSAKKAPVPISSIRKTALLQSTSANIIDALSHTPGVSQLSTGPAISKPFIRGLGYNRVVVVNEGVRQEGQQWGDEHGVEIDELSIGRAEIMKGPASLMYGSDALAGVINFITHIPVAEGTIKGNIISNYQSNNELWAINGQLAGNQHGFNWNIYGTHKSAGDYRNKFDGRVLNSRFKENNFGGYIGLNKNWGYSHLVFSRFDQRIGMVEGDRDNNGEFLLFAGSPLERTATATDLSSRNFIVPFQRVQHYKVSSDNNFVIKRNRLKLNLGYQDNIRQEFGNPENPTEKELFFDLSTFTYNAQWQLPGMKEWHSTIGLNGMSQTNRNKGEEVLIPEYNLFDLGLFLYTQRFFKKATLSGGLRFDNRSLHSRSFNDGSVQKFQAFEKQFSNISGSLGLSYEPSEKLNLKFNLARGFRAPGIPELSSNGVHEGSNRYEYGSLSLGSESSLQADAGVEWSYEHFNLGLSGFYNRMNDFIFYRKLESISGGDSLVHVDGKDVPAYQFNQRDASLAGIEATLDIHPHPLDWLHIEHNFSFTRGRFDHAIDGSNNLPLIPAPRLISELRGDFKKVGSSFKNLYVKVEADINFRQDKAFTGYNTETTTGGYTLLNLGAGADIMNGKKNIFSLYLGVTNLLDKAYQNHLSRLKYTDINPITGRQGVFNTGRNFSVKLNVPLEYAVKKAH